mmetsp:Transcript_148848/g.260071  ORF Transcript_148848/g.260071 Transcript_148848/m.260071 type:complete len:173 (-) Transcript_148848:94-612(-)
MADLDDLGDKGSPVFSLFEKLVRGKEHEMPEDRGAWAEWFNKRLEDYESQALPKMHIPELMGEAEFEKKLRENKDKLMIVKFWKHQCLPCLSYGPFLKKAEEELKKNPNVVFYSVDIKRPENLKLSAWQRIMGTPSLQTFHGMRQVGECIESTGYTGFMAHISKSLDYLKIT